MNTPLDEASGLWLITPKTATEHLARDLYFTTDKRRFRDALLNMNAKQLQAVERLFRQSVEDVEAKLPASHKGSHTRHAWWLLSVQNELQKRNESLDLDEAAIHNKAKELFGTTDDFKEAGWMLPDGSMLDFSGKKHGGQGGRREMDHRDIGQLDELPGGTHDLQKFAATGAIRLMPEAPAVYMCKKPTSQQLHALARWFMRFRNEAPVIELEPKPGKWDTEQDFYRQGPGSLHKEYALGVNPATILNDIRRFYHIAEDAAWVALLDEVKKRTLPAGFPAWLGSSTGTEPWKQTLDDYLATHLPKNPSALTKHSYMNTHRYEVEAALKQKKPVPAAVLKDYPDLERKHESVWEAEAPPHVIRWAEDHGLRPTTVVKFKKLGEWEVAHFTHPSPHKGKEPVHRVVAFTPTGRALQDTFTGPTAPKDAEARFKGYTPSTLPVYVKVTSHRGLDRLKDTLGRKPKGYYSFHKEGHWYEVTPAEQAKVLGIAGVVKAKLPDDAMQTIHYESSTDDIVSFADALDEGASFVPGLKLVFRGKPGYRKAKVVHTASGKSFGDTTRPGHAGYVGDEEGFRKALQGALQHIDWTKPVEKLDKAAAKKAVEDFYGKTCFYDSGMVLVKGGKYKTSKERYTELYAVRDAKQAEAERYKMHPSQIPGLEYTFNSAWFSVLHKASGKGLFQFKHHSPPEALVRYTDTFFKKHPFDWTTPEKKMNKEVAVKILKAYKDGLGYRSGGDYLSVGTYGLPEGVDEAKGKVTPSKVPGLEWHMDGKRLLLIHKASGKDIISTTPRGGPDSEWNDEWMKMADDFFAHRPLDWTKPTDKLDMKAARAAVVAFVQRLSNQHSMGEVMNAQPGPKVPALHVGPGSTTNQEPPHDPFDTPAKIRRRMKGGSLDGREGPIPLDVL